MSHHLIKTRSQNYPPYTGEFLAVAYVKNGVWGISCPPFPPMTFGPLVVSPHADAEEALAIYCVLNKVELIEYCPVIRGQNLVELPIATSHPVCFINCTFANHLCDGLNMYFSTSRFYQCQLPAAFRPALRFTVNIVNVTGTNNLDKITPDTLTELITQHWSQYDLKVTVRS